MWTRVYRCPECKHCSTEWSHLCPCYHCGQDNKEGELIRMVGKAHWRPTWRNWFRRSYEFKE